MRFKKALPFLSPYLPFFKPFAVTLWIITLGAEISHSCSHPRRTHLKKICLVMEGFYTYSQTGKPSCIANSS